MVIFTVHFSVDRSRSTQQRVTSVCCGQVQGVEILNRKPSRFPDEGLVGLAILFNQVKTFRLDFDGENKNSRNQASSPVMSVFSERTHHERE